MAGARTCDTFDKRTTYVTAIFLQNVKQQHG